MGDHSEAVEIDFDPARIGYDRLLDIFWKGHDPFSNSWARQYKTAIFYHGEEQRRWAKASKKHIEEKTGRRVVTEIVPASAFHLAEGYHQKYMLQGNPGIADELRVYYPDDTRFTASMAAARLNGYLGGHGTLKQLKAEIVSLGLSPGSSRMLWELVRKRDNTRGNRDTESMDCPVR